MSAAVLIVLAGLAAAPDSVHPDLRLLDAEGQPVLTSGGPISFAKTCGECHDVAWIEAHSYHAGLGADRPYTDADRPRPFDTAAGPWGRFDPLTYRRLSGPEEARPDTDPAAWARVLGPRHVGGGPVRAVDPAAELNCFLCHSGQPNLDARARAIQAGQWAWVGTATLEGSTVVQASAAGWTYAPEAFAPDHTVAAEALGVAAATSERCGACHGVVPPAGPSPLTLPARSGPRPDPTLSTGLVYSGQPMLQSGVNLAGKAELTRPWDIHAERMLACSDCHGALNDPVHGVRDKAEQPAHLKMDVRGMALQDYLRRPQHDFATGRAAPGVLGARHAGSMKRCEDCHDAGQAHDWLPYPERHLQAMLCEACHVPEVRSPLLESVDWSILTPERGPRMTYRGVEGAVDDPRALVTGFTPVLLARGAAGAPAKMAPHNLVTSFYWVEGDPPRPVREADLQAALFQGEAYAPAIVAALDADHDGQLTAPELALDTEAKLAAVASALRAVGVVDPRPVGEIQPYGLHHQVGSRGFAVKDCQSCHGARSRFAQSVRLASRAPAGVIPTVVKDAPVGLAGEIVPSAGELRYVPAPAAAGLYLLGQGGHGVVDQLGWAAVLLVLAGSVLHGGARLWARRRPHAEEERS